MNISPAAANLLYLLASILFIIGLKGLTHPRSAVRGNLIGALGMLVAILTALMMAGLDWTLIISGLAIGTILGVVLAIRVQMTAMPQLVALLNGLGGAASVLVAAAYLLIHGDIAAESWEILVSTAASALIGGITLSGSLIAYAKLAEWKSVKDFRFPGQAVANITLLVISLLFGALLIVSPGQMQLWYWLMVVVALGLGFLLVIGIGGADMPVVIALLNSYSGLAAAATGFVLSNSVLIVSGSLVGASGLILTKVMCQAMNRSLPAVLFGTLQGGTSNISADETYRTVKSTTPTEVAILLDTARRVVIVPGYGLAVSQAQHAVRDLVNLLISRGAQVEFAIHPVAGRMPGHMNVLLAEADIPYELQKEMNDINPEMDQIDVAIIVGANDVVNPLARTDPQSPIAGMPILDVDKARLVVVIKRSLSPGFAGIPNPLFAAPNTLMLYADAKKALLDIVKAVQEG